jgi:hypothetical protein
VQLFDNVYAEQTPYLSEQQRWYADYCASFAPDGGASFAPDGGASFDGDDVVAGRQ